MQWLHLKIYPSGDTASGQRTDGTKKHRQVWLTFAENGTQVQDLATELRRPSLHHLEQNGAHRNHCLIDDIRHADLRIRLAAEFAFNSGRTTVPCQQVRG